MRKLLEFSVNVREEVQISNSEGRLISDVRVRTRMFVDAYAKEGEIMMSGGELYTFEYQTIAATMIINNTPIIFSSFVGLVYSLYAGVAYDESLHGFRSCDI